MNCAICHGTGGRGDGVGSRRLKSPTPDFTRPGFWKGKSDAYLFHLISNGIGDMPAWSDRLTPGQITDVLHYIRSLPDPAPENRQPPSR
ncbi:MAG: cytochrome c [Nitrospirae bacterium]|nr:cytochrome c [Nitrospirota bacterium]